MSSLAQTALDFCRECMGWEDASSDHSPDGVIWNGKHRESMAGFHYTDLNAVMEAVRGWCQTHNAVVETSCAKGSVMARVRLLGISGEPYWQHCDDLQEALLVASVEASRKLNGNPT